MGRWWAAPRRDSLSWLLERSPVPLRSNVSRGAGDVRVFAGKVFWAVSGWVLWEGRVGWKKFDSQAMLFAISLGLSFHT